MEFQLGPCCTREVQLFRVLEVAEVNWCRKKADEF